MRLEAISDLVQYGVDRGLIEPQDWCYTVNRVLDILQLDDGPTEKQGHQRPLPDILNDLLTGAVESHLIKPDDIDAKDRLDAKLMDCLTPMPSKVSAEFSRRYAVSPLEATEYFNQLCKDVNYIHADRIAQDRIWFTPSAYGQIECNINLSKPEKDPLAIAAARNSHSIRYPMCQLCVQNEGYRGNLQHPGRSNLRLIPIQLDGEPWALQYSPYAYFSDHCIALKQEHTPMRITNRTFRRMLDFVDLFPQYFIGSNADLPLVGGSILSHDHFQGGKHTFALMEAPLAAVLEPINGVNMGIVRWPMSVLRLESADRERLLTLATRVLDIWRHYSDPSVELLAQTGSEPHNTISPVAIKHNGVYRLDMILRNNRTTNEYPLGLFHIHPEYFHIKKENLGIIDIQGMAILPPRLNREFAQIVTNLREGRSLSDDPLTMHHAQWISSFSQAQRMPENIQQALLDETSHIFIKMLKNAGIFKETDKGRQAFLRFVSAL